MNTITDKILNEFKNVSDKDKLEFYNQAYITLNALEPSKTKQILESTRIKVWFDEKQKKVLEKLKNNKFQFYYDLRVLQIEDLTSKIIKNYKLESANEILEQLDLDDSLEGIISKGFIIQSKTYEIIQLAKNL